MARLRSRMQFEDLMGTVGENIMDRKLHPLINIFVRTKVEINVTCEIEVGTFDYLI